MKDIILEKLSQIEKDNNVKILYACESGSRAWGFASTDSDFDVRFVYTHTLDFYLTIDNAEDVIELPVNEVLDISGWDVRKALKLFRKSNAPLLEWLQSPIIYQKNENFHDELVTLAADYFIPRNGYNHYLNMTVNTFENDLAGDKVRLKKYFYALRPVLACLWTVDKGTLPPMEFSKLRVIVNNDDIQQSFDKLLKQKAVVDEKYVTEPIATLHNFINESINYCKMKETNTLYKVNETATLNKFFRKYLNESWPA